MIAFEFITTICLDLTPLGSKPHICFPSHSKRLKSSGKFVIVDDSTQPSKCCTVGVKSSIGFIDEFKDIVLNNCVVDIHKPDCNSCKNHTHAKKT